MGFSCKKKKVFEMKGYKVRKQLRKNMRFYYVIIALTFQLPKWKLQNPPKDPIWPATLAISLFFFLF